MSGKRNEIEGYDCAYALRRAFRGNSAENFAHGNSELQKPNEISAPAQRPFNGSATQRKRSKNVAFSSKLNGLQFVCSVIKRNALCHAMSRDIRGVAI